MRYVVTVIPKAKVNSVEQIATNRFKVKTTAPAQDGKANQALIKILADYFKVSKSSIEILTGETSRQKLIEVEG